MPVYRRASLVIAAGVFTAAGCTSHSLHTFSGASTRSDLAMQALEASTAEVLASQASMETKQDALERLEEVQSLLARVDIAAARLAGVPMTDAEAAEANELLRVAYRHLALHASLGALETYAAEGANGDPSLGVVEDVLRTLTVLTGTGG